MIRLLSAAVLCIAIASAAHAGFPDPAPIFVGAPYEFTVDVSPPGPQSFSFTGQAVDPNPAQVVTVVQNIFPFGFFFSSVPGNPASFTISAPALDFADSGRRTFRIGAFDNAPGGPSTVSTTVVVNVIPEPATLAGVVGATVQFARLRRRTHGATTRARP